MYILDIFDIKSNPVKKNDHIPLFRLDIIMFYFNNMMDAYYLLINAALGGLWR